MAILSIRLYPDPVLRVRCPEVTLFDEDLRRLAEDMAETMYDAPGVGLAAPQVGIETRLAVVDACLPDGEDGLHILVNPQIVATEGADIDLEGCLSIPGITDKVQRARRVTVRAQDLDGVPFELDAQGVLARVILHEVDHLDGVLFIDRLRGLRRERAKRQLRRLKTESVLA